MVSNMDAEIRYVQKMIDSPETCPYRCAIIEQHFGKVISHYCGKCADMLTVSDKTLLYNRIGLRLCNDKKFPVDCPLEVYGADEQ